MLVVAMTIYVALSLFLFFTWVNPSLIGQTQQHIAADSVLYMAYADSLREGLDNPFVLAAMYSFPNTLWMPVLLFLALQSTLLIVALNYTLFIWSVWLFSRSVDIRVGIFLALLLVNITTTISLLSVNKEIVDLLATALFCYWLSKGRKWALALALLIALVNRYEVCIAMLLFIVLRSRWNPLRKSRYGSLAAVSVAFSIALPSLSVTDRLDEAVSATSATGSSGLILVLDNLQAHYLFFLAVIPKIAHNLFSQILILNNWTSYGSDNPANTYVMLLNNLASSFVVMFLIKKGRLRLKSEWMYYAGLSAIVMSLALVVQPRYFYSCYALLCLEAARVCDVNPLNGTM
jgi:hypothetical protein